MNKLNRSLIAAMLLGSVATPTFAEEKQASELPVFEAADYGALFEAKSKGVEVAALSNKEMKETEGSFRNNVIKGMNGFTTIYDGKLPNGQSVTVVKGQSANGQSISVQSSFSGSGSSSVSVYSRSSVTSSGGSVSANVVSQVGSSGAIYTYNYSSNGSHPPR